MPADLDHLKPKTQKLVLGLMQQFPDLKINSGYRDPARNAAAGGAKGSQHIGGNAVDLNIADFDDETKSKVMDAAIELGANAFGIYPSGKFLHIDLRDTPMAWGTVPGAKYKGNKDITSYPQWAQPSLTRLFKGNDMAKKNVKSAVQTAYVPPSEDEVTDDDVNETMRLAGVIDNSQENNEGVTDDDINATLREAGIDDAATLAKDGKQLTQDQYDNMNDKEREAYTANKKPTFDATVKSLQKSTGSARPLPEQTFTGHALSSIPVAGPLLNRLDAVMGAGTSYLTGRTSGNKIDPEDSFGDRYNQAYSDKQNADNLWRSSNPIKAAGAEAMGSLPLLPLAEVTAGGVVSPAALMGNYGPNAFSKMLTGAAGGGALGGADSYLRTKSIGDAPGWNDLISATMGAGLGIAAPAAGAVMKSGTTAALNNFFPRDPIFKGLKGGTINKLTGAIEGETEASLAAARQRMGSAGFLGDVNSGMTDIAGGLAHSTGTPKQVVRQAYQGRADQQAARIEKSFDKAFGERQDILAKTKQIEEARATAADPHYEAWRSMKVQPTQKIKDNIIPRLEASGAFKMADEIAAIQGKTGTTKFFTTGSKDFPTTESWDYVKQGLDRRIDAAYAGGDKVLGRNLVKLKNDMLDEIEKTPAGKEWAKGREEYASHSSLLDQVERGRDTFAGSRSGQTVAEFSDEWGKLNKKEKQVRIESTRDFISEVMGDTLKGDTTMRNKLLATNNQKKLKLMLGEKKGSSIIRKLESEEYLANQKQNVMGGSQTTSNTERVKALQPESIGDVWNPNLMQPLSFIPKPFAEMTSVGDLIDAWKGLGAEKVNNQLAQLITMKGGPTLNQLLQALPKEALRRGKNIQTGQNAGNALTKLISVPGSNVGRSQLQPQ